MPRSHASLPHASPPEPSVGLFSVRPMAVAPRIALFEKEVRERLSRAALDVIFARAEILSEGQRTVRAGRAVFAGSTMLTLVLDAFADVLRESVDAATARKLALLLADDAHVAARVRKICAREVERVAGARPREVTTEMKTSARGTRVLIDVDVEAHLP